MANRAQGALRPAAIVTIALALGGHVLGCAHRPAPEARSAAPPSERASTDSEGALPPRPAPIPPPREGASGSSFSQEGYATWYGAALAGHKMANGKPFDPRRLTAAHLKLKLGTWVEVRRVDTGQVVRVCITDRGPYGHADRIIDLSRAAADKIGLVKVGLAKVAIRVVAGP